MPKAPTRTLMNWPPEVLRAPDAVRLAPQVGEGQVA